MRGWFQIAAFAAGIACCVPAPLEAQQTGPIPEELDGIDVVQKLDARVPMETRFTDEAGNDVALSSYFENDRPVLLTLVYYRCPMLCTLVLDGMVTALEEIDWVPGREFDIVTVSIDHREGPELARDKKETYVRRYGRPEAAEGWHFLTGTEESVAALADAVGFGYRYVEESGEFAHPATLVMLTPEGRVSRYLFGVNHEPKTMRLSLVEASEGRIGSLVDQFLLYCYRYDAKTGQYTPMAWRMMRLGGLITATALAAILLTFWRRESRSRRAAEKRTA